MRLRLVAQKTGLTDGRVVSVVGRQLLVFNFRTFKSRRLSLATFYVSSPYR